MTPSRMDDPFVVTLQTWDTAPHILGDRRTWEGARTLAVRYEEAGRVEVQRGDDRWLLWSRALMPVRLLELTADDLEVNTHPQAVPDRAFEWALVPDNSPNGRTMVGLSEGARKWAVEMHQEAEQSRRRLLLPLKARTFALDEPGRVVRSVLSAEAASRLWDELTAAGRVQDARYLRATHWF